MTPLTTEYLTEMVRAYQACAVWAGLDHSTGEDGGDSLPLDENWGTEDIGDTAVLEALVECQAFIEANEALLWEAYITQGYCAEQAGHDFFLTRNGHGTGFWDRGLDSVGDKLADAARAYGTRELWPDGDQLVWGG